MMRLIVLYIICLIGCSPMLYGQSDEEVFKKINQANAQVNDNPNNASALIQEALEMAINSENSRAQAYCYNTLGAIHYKLNAFQLAVDYYYKSYELFEKIVDPKGKYNTLKYIGPAYEANGEYTQANTYYLLFLELAQNTGNEKDRLSTIINLGRLSYNNDNQIKAKNYFNQALKIQESNGDEKGIAQTKLWLGMVEEKLGNDEQAVQNWNESSQKALDINDMQVAQEASNSLGNYYNTNKRNPEAIQVQQKAYEINQIRGNRSGELDNAKNIARYQLDDNNPIEAIPYIKQTLEISKELADLEALTDANLMLSEAYEQQGNYDSALVEYKRYLQLVDSVENVQAKKELMSLKLTQQLNNKVSELEKVKAELRSEKLISENLNAEYASMKERRRADKIEQNAKDQKSRLIMFGLLALILIGGVSTWLIYRSAQDKKRANQLLALKSLRSQMNPHFIFNSLNSVNSFIARNDERSANKYLSEFSKLMRAVMENSKHDLVPLASEIDILKMYLDLEHLRFKDKFDYEFIVEDGIMIEEVEIPPMLLQPYIENAIWHGLRYKEEFGHLKVHFKMASSYIAVCIEDNGIGRQKSQDLKTRNQKENVSTGMKNIEGRITILNDIHKTNLDIELEDLTHENGDSAGTRVNIKIPYNINKEAA